MPIHKITIGKYTVQVHLENSSYPISISTCFTIYPLPKKKRILFFNVEGKFVYPLEKLKFYNNTLKNIEIQGENINHRYVFSKLRNILPTVFDKNVIRKYNINLKIKEYKDSIVESLRTFLSEDKVDIFCNKYFTECNIEEKVGYIDDVVDLD